MRTCEECKELTLRLAFTDQTGKPSTRRQTPSEQTAMSDMDMAAVEDSDVEMSQPVEGEDEVKSRDQPQTAENETSESDEDAEDDASLSVDENSGDDAEEGEIEEDEDEDVDVGWSDSESDSDDQPVQPGRSQARTRACKYRCSHCSHYVERIAGRKRSTLRAALRRHLKQRHNMSDSDAAEQAREIIPLLPITDRSTKAMQRREKMHKLKNERLTDDEADELKKWVFRHYSDYLIQRLAKRMGFSLTIEQVSELFGVSSVGWFNNIAEKLDRYEDSEGKRYYWYQWGKGLGCFELDHEIEICTGTWAPVKAIMDDTGDVTAAYKQLLQCVDLCEILHIDNLQPLSTTDHIKKTIAERQKRAGLCMDITFDKGGGPPRSPHRRKKVGKQVAKKVEQEATTEEPDGGAALAEEETKLTSDDENQQTAAATLPTQTHTPVTVPRDGLDRTLGLWGTLAEQERQRREEQNRIDRQAHEERRVRDRQRQRHAMRVRQATFNWKWVLSGRPVLTGPRSPHWKAIENRWREQWRRWREALGVGSGDEELDPTSSESHKYSFSRVRNRFFVFRLAERVKTFEEVAEWCASWPDR